MLVLPRGRALIGAVAVLPVILWLATRKFRHGTRLLKRRRPTCETAEIGQRREWKAGGGVTSSFLTPNIPKPLLFFPLLLLKGTSSCE